MAAISDIHGNVWALEAVLRDMTERNVEMAVNLGDCIYGPLLPSETLDILTSYEIPTVSGNEDRLLSESDGHETMGGTAAFVLAELTDDQLWWLKGLPRTKRIGVELFLCHGTPDSDTEYLLREVTPSGVHMREAEIVEKLLTGIDSSVVLCGHDHLQGEMRLPDGRLVVDPGSVGLQAYTGESPFPHRIEAGSPHARYSILVRSNEGWRVEHHRVEYDWRPAAAAAADRGRPDWAQWLRTGRVG
jgi:predicted phosphodiesterase